MTDYTALATALKTTIQADAWLGDTDNVKTLRLYGGDFSLQGEEGTPFHKEAELPTMNIIPNASPKEQDHGTVGEILEEIYSEIVTCSRGSSSETAETTHLTIISYLETRLDAQKTSSADLGIEALIKDVSTSTERWKKGDKYHYLSTTSFTVLLTTTY